MENMNSEDRREDCRAEIPVCLWVEIPLAFSYEAAEEGTADLSHWDWEDLALPPDVLRAMVDDNDMTIKDPLLLQMLTRIDWMLTSIMKTLGKDKKMKGAIPEFTTVNLSGSGIRFVSEQTFSPDTVLILRMILRPFIPIQAIGKVLRVTPRHKGKKAAAFDVAVEFTHIASDDREAIIRHILRSQATLQRLRLQAPVDSTVG